MARAPHGNDESSMLDHSRAFAFPIQTPLRTHMHSSMADMRVRVRLCVRSHAFFGVFPVSNVHNTNDSRLSDTRERALDVRVH